MGRRFTALQLEAALHFWGLPHEPTGNCGPEKRELTVLGLRGVTVTPLLLARAYRQMLLQEATDGGVARFGELWDGFASVNPRGRDTGQDGNGQRTR